MNDHDLMNLALHLDILTGEINAWGVRPRGPITAAKAREDIALWERLDREAKEAEAKAAKEAARRANQWAAERRRNRRAATRNNQLETALIAALGR